MDGTVKRELFAIAQSLKRLAGALRSRLDGDRDHAWTTSPNAPHPSERSEPSPVQAASHSSLGASGVGIVIIDQHGIIRSVNSTAAVMFDSRAEQLIGGKIEDLSPQPQGWIHSGDLEGGPNSGDARILGIRRNIEGLWANGSTVPMELEVVRIPLETDQLFLVLVRNITQPNQVRHSLPLETIGKLTTGIVRDFNNLLADVGVSTDLLQDKIGDEDHWRALVEQFAGSVVQGKSLTERLLTLSREQPWAPQVWDVFDLVGNLEDLLRRTLGDSIKVLVEQPADLWPARIDGHQLVYALLNLAINARDAMPAGGAIKIQTANVTLNDIQAGAYEGLAPGDYVRVAFGDTGMGMTPRMQERVMDPFFTTKKAGERSGLGLFMVYWFAKRSKGHLTIASEPGKGTVVTLYLPRSEESAGGDGL